MAIGFARSRHRDAVVDYLQSSADKVILLCVKRKLNNKTKQRKL